MNCILRIAVLAILAPVVGAPSAAAERPNVLFLLTDDQHHETIRALGNLEIETPNLDRLVHDGSTMTHAFCMGSMSPAVCMPSRAMLLTGRHLFRTTNQIPEDQPMWPQTMRRAGYFAFGTGKWHNGPASFARAFDDGGAIFFGGMSDQRAVPVSPFDSSGRYPKERRTTSDVFSSELFAGEAIEFLQRYDEQRPFFLYVSFTAPHDPRTPPEEYAAKYHPESLSLPANFMPVHPFNNGEMKIRDEQLAPWPRTPEAIRRHTADYYGMITHLDAQIGRILEALEQSGRRENTIIVFASDHGLALGRHGLLGKQNLYDHSVRAPLIFVGPGIPAGERFDALCYLHDIFPTVCQLAGVPIPETVDGQSLVPVLQGEQREVRDSIFGAYRDVQRMVRTRDWKLIRYPHINKTQLFHLADDPDELVDLANDPRHAPRVEELTALLIDWQQRTGDREALSTDEPQPLVIPLP